MHLIACKMRHYSGMKNYLVFVLEEDPHNVEHTHTHTHTLMNVVCVAF